MTWKHMLLSVLGFAVFASGSTEVAAIELFIDKIRQDEEIVGYVTEANDVDLSELKVLVYVKTDRWYIHPYAGQGKGLSWTTVNPKGVWRIETVKRKFDATEVAALLVDQDYHAPHRTDSLNRIPYKTIKILELIGTANYGKL